MKSKEQKGRDRKESPKVDPLMGKTGLPEMVVWLDMMLSVVPPQQVLLVGAGSGRGRLAQWMKRLDEALVGIPMHLVEGDEQQFRYLQRAFSDSRSCTLWQEVIAPHPEPVTFYRASNPRESGLISAEKLRSLWPNLDVQEALRIRSPTTLKALNEKAGGKVNWLLLDCLPGAALLQGSGQFLEELDLALIRVANGLPEVELADQRAVDSVMGRYGFRPVHSHAERHPELAHILYVRDIGHLLVELQRSREESQLKLEASASKLKAAEVKWEKERKHLEQARHEGKHPAPTRTVAGGDANIDDFLSDISEYLKGKSITYVDVGAYEGEILLKISSHGKVAIREAHLFEPNPESFRRLEENVRGLKLSKLRLYKLALGSRESKLTFSSAKSMTKVMSSEENLADQPGSFISDSRKLDDLVGNFTDRRIDVLKIDVEGFELEVIVGATELLKDQRVDIIYIEVGFNKEGTQQTYFALVDSRLQELGYRVFKIYEQTSEWILDSPLLRRCNFAYMSEKFAAGHPSRMHAELTKLREELARMKSGDS